MKFLQSQFIVSSLAMNHLTITILFNDFTSRFTPASSTTIVIPPANRTCIGAELILRDISLPHNRNK